MSIQTVARSTASPIHLLVLLAGLLTCQSAWSFQNREYFVPLPEDDLLQSLRDIANSSSPRSPVNSTISLTIGTGGTLVYWDQWEDGAYENDIFNPTNIFNSATNPQGTQIWGDRDLSNGCPPIKNGVPNPCLVADDDFLSSGDVAFTRNRIPIGGSNGSYFRNPTSDCTFETGATLIDHCFDGRDKIGTTFPVVVSRAGWANGSGTLLSGSVGVTDTRGFLLAGGSTEAPVGPDTFGSVSMFQYSAFHIMAGEAGAQVSVTNTGGPGADPLNFTLGQGESRLVRFNDEGAVVTITGGAAQVHLLTGDIGARYESRWFNLPPASSWSQAYITPVGTGSASTGTCTRIFAYNPSDTADLTVTFTQGNPASSSTFDVPPNSARPSPFVTDGNAARVEAPSPFYALSVTDCEGGTLHDWGLPLVPVPQLTTEVLTGWSPGCTTSNCGSSGSGSNDLSRGPLWITPESGSNVDVYVDYDGSGAICIGSSTVFGKAEKLTLDAGQAVKVTDNPPANPQTGSQGDFDMTGARVFTCDGTKVAVAWGLDPVLSGSTDHEALDMGNTVPPLGTALRCTVQADKDLVLAQGDKQVTYVFRLYNDGEIPLGEPNHDDIHLNNVFTSGTVQAATPPDPASSPLCLEPRFVGGDTNGNKVLEQDEVWEYTCKIDVVPQEVSPPTTPATYIPTINAAVAESLNPTLESQACQWEITVIDADLDFGDTPSSYGAPSHVIEPSPDLFLGPVSPDADPGLQNSAPNDVNALGDDNDGGDDEDGVLVFLDGASTVAAIVAVSKTSADDATLCGWLDGGSTGATDGLFDIAEGQCVNVASAGNVRFDWPGVPDSVLTDSYARFRLVTGFLGTADGGLGIAQDGEVEDYHISFFADDHGDAPTGGADVGGIPRSYGDASHIIPVAGTGPILGSVVPDAEPGAQPSPGADGDDINGIPDDEDGLVLVQALQGGTIRTRVAVLNRLSAPVTLCGWIDGESGTVDGFFDANEGQCVEVQVGGNPVDFDWTLPIGGGQPVQTYARFRVAPLADAMSVSNPAGGFTDGEVEDYTLTILPTRATIGSFGVGLVPAESFDLIDPGTGEPVEPPSGGAAQVLWQTLVEEGTLGFYLDRWDAGSAQWVRVNDEFLPGLIDAPLGGQYQLYDLDVAVGEHHRYRLIEQEAWGTKRSYGPYDVVVGDVDANAVDGSRAAPTRSRSLDRRSQESADSTDGNWGEWRRLGRAAHFYGRPRLPTRLRRDVPPGEPGAGSRELRHRLEPRFRGGHLQRESNQPRHEPMDRMGGTL